MLLFLDLVFELDICLGGSQQGLKDRRDVDQKEEKMPFLVVEKNFKNPEANLILYFSNDHSLFSKG